MARKNSCNFGCLQPRKSCQERKLIAVVKGAVGPTGPTGPIGRTGVTGATGPTGGEVVARTVGFQPKEAIKGKLNINGNFLVEKLKKMKHLSKL